jgi:hypothetical protein
LGITIYQEKATMKPHLSQLILVFSLLVALVGVAAAPMASGTARLLGVEYIPNKGPVFTFEVSGKFPRSALKGMVELQGGGRYPLYCVQAEETIVKCSTSQKVSAVDVWLTWGGFVFWTTVPGVPLPQEPRELDGGTNGGTGQYCYDIFDYDLDYVWRSYGSRCQAASAQYNDIVTYYNADWEGSYPAIFMPQGPSCSGLVKDAYYGPACPE